jgi:hypothetical protein
MRHKLIITLAYCGLLLSFVSRTQAASVDANGTTTSDPRDGKSTVADNSKGKETPLVQSGCVAPKDTEFRIGLPSWTAGLSGDFGLHGVVTQPDVDFTQILNHLDMLASGALYARYHRWEFSADGLYMKLSDTADSPSFLFNGARVSLKQAFAEWLVGYRLINCEKGFLSVTVGGRYNYMNGDFRVFSGFLPGRRVEAGTDWVDPVIGTSGRVHLWKAISLWAKGDIGGFGAASDLTWQVQGGLEVQATRWIYSDIGWRYLKYDYTSGGFTNKTELSGPYLETGFTF